MNDDPSSHDLYASWLEKIRRKISANKALRGHDTKAPLLSAGDEVVNGLEKPVESFIAAIDDPHSVGAEQFRLFAVRLEGLWKQPGFQRVAITSTLPGEGKSFTTINVACVLAKDFGRRVLVIDGDFRKPTLWRFLGNTPSKGILDVIAKPQEINSAVHPLRFQNLGVLGVGLTSVNPTRFWKSQAIKHLFAEFERQYDYIIVDTPPVLTVVDTTLIADLVDGVVVIVRTGTTPKASLQKAIASIPRAKLVGTVFNGAKGLRAYQYYHLR